MGQRDLDHLGALSLKIRDRLPDGLFHLRIEAFDKILFRETELESLNPFLESSGKIRDLHRPRKSESNLSGPAITFIRIAASRTSLVMGPI